MSSDEDRDFEDAFEVEWARYWQPELAPGGVVDLEKVKGEIHDYSFMLEQVPRVYMEVTGGLLSKSNYYADSVISAYNDERQKDCERACDEQIDVIMSILEDLKGGAHGHSALSALRDVAEEIEKLRSEPKDELEQGHA